MTESIIIGVVAAFGSIIVAAIGKTGAKKDQEQAFYERLGKRVEALESEVAQQRKDIDDERHARFAAERRTNELQLALARGLHALRNIADWVREGAEPPPPDVTRTINELEKAMRITE